MVTLTKFIETIKTTPTDKIKAYYNRHLDGIVFVTGQTGEIFIYKRS